MDASVSFYTSPGINVSMLPKDLLPGPIDAGDNPTMSVNFAWPGWEEDDSDDPVESPNEFFQQMFGISISTRPTPRSEPLPEWLPMSIAHGAIEFDFMEHETYGMVLRSFGLMRPPAADHPIYHVLPSIIGTELTSLYLQHLGPPVQDLEVTVETEIVRLLSECRAVWDAYIAAARSKKPWQDLSGYKARSSLPGPGDPIAAIQILREWYPAFFDGSPTEMWN